MNELFGGYAGLPKWVELGDFPNVVYEELERQVKPIDPELYQYMVNVPKNSYTLDIVIKSMISVGSYPYARKIQEMKKAFLGGVDALSSLTRFFMQDIKAYLLLAHTHSFLMQDMKAYLLLAHAH